MEMNTNHKFPQIMGILNITPDSFSDGGSYLNFDNAKSQVEQLIEDGADIIDIGGESTRPGSKAVSAEEEMKRVIPIIEFIVLNYPKVPISIDTTKHEVARQALESGATILNHIGSIIDNPKMVELAAEKKVDLFVMHIKGTPRTMQQNPQYDDVVGEVYSWLEDNINFAKKAGVKNVIGDVGIGFGKTVEHNLKLLKRHDEFNKLGVEMLLGISRKIFIGKLLNIEIPAERDLGTVLIHSLLLAKGIDYIRVHNVRYLSILKKLYNALV